MSLVSSQTTSRPHRTSIHLNRRFGSAKTLTIEARAIEAARPTLSGYEHRAGIFAPTRARLFLFGGGDPVDPISARHGRDVRPQGPRLRGGCESFSQIGRHRGFRFLCHGRDLQRNDVAGVCARRFAHVPVHFEPVAFFAVWLERGSKGAAIDGAFDCRHAPRRELRADVFWQGEKGPGAGLRRRLRPDEFRCETDLRSGFAHLPCITHRNGKHVKGR